MKRLVAALTFFTRLPLWRVVELEKKHYERVVPLWPVVGWVTGGTMALVFWGANMLFPMTVSVVLALVSRILLTGALHEDGFADFCDGFGGGTTRERTLEIMKDSHIGTYGVLGLVMYAALIVSVLSSLPASFLCFILVGCDTLSKMLSSTIVYFLPYARKESEAKSRLVYANVTWSEKLITLILGLAPFVFCPAELRIPFAFAALASIIACVFLFTLMHKKIKGYTGDCCGATFIILETVAYLTISAVLVISIH